jgi:hypothetical protein
VRARAAQDSDRGTRELEARLQEAQAQVLHATTAREAADKASEKASRLHDILDEVREREGGRVNVSVVCVFVCVCLCARMRASASFLARWRV